MLGVAATVVLVAFDSTIVSTTLPRVAEALNGLALYSWVGTGYLLTTAASILIFGRMGDMFGRKPMMMVSVSLVALGSISCGLSQTMLQLTLFRALQGIGGGMMIATAFAAPADLFPEARERVRWLALTTSSYAMASGIGPVLGGAATQALGWRAAFFIAPVTAVIGLVLIGRYFPTIPPHGSGPRRIDWLGCILLVVLVASPLAALQLGFATSGVSHPLVALCLALAAIVAALALPPHLRRKEMPIFPLRVLASKEARMLNMAAIATGAVMFILIFYSPLLLQREFGYTPSQAGLLITPQVVAIAIGSLINGRLFPRQAEPQRLLAFGGWLLAAGSLMVLAIGDGTPVAWILLSFFTTGAALGFVLANLTLFIQMLSERRDVGTASALVQTTRAIGSALGTALVGIAVSHTSVRVGVRIGLVLCVAMALTTAFVGHKITMRNVMQKRSA
ncbi:MAG TPA: MFS transporter [Bordetella sp.]